MKKISLQWRITLMTAILIGITCVSMNSLIGYSGRHYMDSIGSDISANSDSYKGEQEFFNPESADLDQEVTIIVNGAQESFSTTNWCITAVVTLLGGVLAYFVSGREMCIRDRPYTIHFFKQYRNDFFTLRPVCVHFFYGILFFFINPLSQPLHHIPDATATDGLMVCPHVLLMVSAVTR